MFDIFYFSKKPDFFSNENKVTSIDEARKKSKTRYFWILNYLSDYSGFDFIWEPPPWEKNYIHAWPSQWQKDGGTYLIPKNYSQFPEIKYHEKIIPRICISGRWEIPSDIDIEEFDFTWHPDPTEPPYIYQFGTQHQKTGGPRYVMEGATETKFVRSVKANKTTIDDNWDSSYGIGVEEFDYTWHPDETEPPYIYQFGTQHQKTGGPRYVMEGARETKFIRSVKANKTTIDDNWEIPPDVDVEEFDYTWHPDETEPPYIYQFGTQHQKTGGPRYVMEGARETKFVKNIYANLISSHAKKVVFIDHYDGNIKKSIKSVNYSDLDISTTRYSSNYFNTLKRIARKYAHEEEYIWVCSSVCDYSDFNFSWHPEQWQSNMIHVFPSNDQKFGDTFFIHLPSFLDQLDTELLEWCNINFIDDISVPRWPVPILEHEQDSHVNLIKNTVFSSPLTLLKNSSININDTIIPTVSLWREKTKTLVTLNGSGSACVVPREVNSYVNTQVYDYPYIEKNDNFASDILQDIIFISYDEPQAEKNWEFLKDRNPRAKRVHGVSGMENALRAAAEKSNTPWYYAVFAKTELNPEFNFSFLPDYLQEPKNYIFDCHNKVNDLVYGHMGIVLYNCNLIKHADEYKNLDLDYTLSFPHESVPILSCFGRFNSTPYQTWRTAFRETSKLCYFQSLNPSIENEYRIHIWTTHAMGHYAEWCLKGANDGKKFAENINYNLGELKNSFRWDWLQNYFESLYGSIDKI